jgi:hypothetical protein
LITVAPPAAPVPATVDTLAELWMIFRIAKFRKSLTYVIVPRELVVRD